MAAVTKLPLLAVLLLATAAKHAPPPPPPPVAAPAPPTIKTGVEKWRAGDYAAAVAIWTPFAADGDPDALFNVGQAYKLGRGVPADAAVARDYYRKAATKGHLPAQANLGIALFQAGEKPEAIKWLKTAADRGEARAQYVLGIAAINGDGIPRSQPLGYGYLLRAQASGLPQAATALTTIAPALSPPDRAAGEAVAASLAAGTGVPPTLAAATAPRLLPGAPSSRLPIVTPATGSPTTVTPATVPPQRAVVASSGVAPPAPAAVPGAPTEKPVLPPAPKPAPPVPVREPTPAQADVAARLAPPTEAGRRDPAITPRRDDPPPAIATVAMPPSRPIAGVTVGAPVTAAGGNAVDPLAPKPSRAPVETARADPLPAAAARQPRPFEVPVEAVKKPDGWRVQLGAFSSRKLADAAWADVRATAAPAKPVFATDGAVTKLQMGPFATRDAAKAACTKLTAAGRACFVTPG